mgnify:CR=1 FL=1
MKALVIGDTCIDEYRYGFITRINPEAPVPLLDIVKVETKKGMAYNVAMNLKGFGVDVDISIPYGNVATKTRYVDIKTNRILMRADKDVECEPYKHRNYEPYDFIVISDYNKGYLSYDSILQIRDRFDGPVYLDTKKSDLSQFQNIFIKINQNEFNKAISFPNKKYLVVTNGSYGCFHDDEHYPAVETEIVDVCGAGDTFLAVMAVFHANTDEMPFALIKANKFAAIACQHFGVYAITEKDVECVSS